ncbi:hypothetical protein [Pantoea cypripedii]|uniref:Uncharacterized protein n=1 Tax=Pantoea cypripedii TaxID=55209 RepID=A0A6B9GBJ2_PANCY|nr:hypothetical protein [Pantoea cypripedii]QGY29806.1 hypothetical protein CUN67_13065 [Pantoea cypripedii]
MISDERLSFIDRNPDMFYPEHVELARELLALRKAFSEPVCCIETPELDYLANGNDGRVYCPEAEEHGDIFLYRKPPTDEM